MADEHVLIFETHTPIPFTCADGTGIEKGTLLKMTDPMTAAAAAAKNDIIAGVAANEKIASDGQTKIAVYRRGVFRAKISGSVTVGDPLIVAGAAANNLLQVADVNSEQVVGTSLETATTGETFFYELNPTVMQLA